MVKLFLDQGREKVGLDCRDVENCTVERIRSISYEGGGHLGLLLKWLTDTREGGAEGEREKNTN